MVAKANFRGSGVGFAEVGAAAGIGLVAQNVPAVGERGVAPEGSGVCVDREGEGWDVVAGTAGLGHDAADLVAGNALVTAGASVGSVAVAADTARGGRVVDTALIGRGREVAPAFPRAEAGPADLEPKSGEVFPRPESVPVAPEEENARALPRPGSGEVRRRVRSGSVLHP